MDMHACIFVFHLNKMLFRQHEDSVLLTVHVILMRVRTCAVQLACNAKCLFVCFLYYALSLLYTVLSSQRFSAVKCQFLGISISSHLGIDSN